MGQDVTRAEINDSLKKFYETGLFSEVELNVTNKILKINVVENPKINKIVFEGNNCLLGV